MENFIQGPAWQILVFLVPLYYGIITPLTTVVPPIKEFFFKDQLHIYLFILVYILPLYYAIIVVLTTTGPPIGNVFFKGRLHIYLLYILPVVIIIITLFAFKKVRAWLLTKLRVIWNFFVAFQSPNKRWKPNQPWIYNFYEQYNEAIPYKMPEYGQRGPEMSGKEPKKALRAQPPPNDSGWYLYKVLLPEKIRQLELSFFIGIRDEVEIPIEASVRFKVKVGDKVAFKEDYCEHRWQHKVVKLEFEPGSEIAISFETEVRGQWAGQGAMWGEPILKGIL